jgi:hypothetical protein
MVALDGAPDSIGLSASGPAQVCALQYEPALSLLPPLMSRPIAPLSKRTPAIGLSNLFRNRLERTPRS